MLLRPCLICGQPSQGTRCPAHTYQRNGSTRQWRKLRAQVLARDRYTCHYCGQPAATVDHFHPLARGGSDQPANLVACCDDCNGRKGADFLDYPPAPDTRPSTKAADRSGRS